MIKGKSNPMEEHANENIQKMKHPCQDDFSGEHIFSGMR